MCSREDWSLIFGCTSHASSRKTDFLVCIQIRHLNIALLYCEYIGDNTCIHELKKCKCISVNIIYRSENIHNSVNINRNCRVGNFSQSWLQISMVILYTYNEIQWKISQFCPNKCYQSQTGRLAVVSFSGNNNILNKMYPVDLICKTDSLN